MVDREPDLGVAYSIQRFFVNSFLRLIFLSCFLVLLGCEEEAPVGTYACTFARVDDTHNPALDGTKPLDQYGYIEAKVLGLVDPDAPRISCPAYVIKSEKQGSELKETIFKFDVTLKYECLKKVLLTNFRLNGHKTKYPKDRFAIYGFVQFPALEHPNIKKGFTKTFGFGDPNETEQFYGPIVGATMGSVKFDAELIFDTKKEKKMVEKLVMYQKNIQENHKEKSALLEMATFSLSISLDNPAAVQMITRFPYIYYKVKPEEDLFALEENQKIISDTLNSYFDLSEETQQKVEEEIILE